MIFPSRLASNISSWYPRDRWAILPPTRLGVAMIKKLNVAVLDTISNRRKKTVRKIEEEGPKTR